MRRKFNLSRCSGCAYEFRAILVLLQSCSKEILPTVRPSGWLTVKQLQSSTVQRTNRRAYCCQSLPICPATPSVRRVADQLPISRAGSTGPDRVMTPSKPLLPCTDSDLNPAVFLATCGVVGAIGVCVGRNWLGLSEAMSGYARCGNARILR